MERLLESKRDFYLVKWKNGGVTWEPLENLQENCKEILASRPPHNIREFLRE